MSMSLEERIRQLENKLIFRNKIIWSTISVTLIFTPLAICFWCAEQGIFREIWVTIFKLLGLVTIVIGSIILAIYLLYWIWNG